LIVALMFVWIGFRGRPVDDHPICRNCGFDLHGSPDRRACSECGAYLKFPRAIRVGHRVPRWRMIRWGTVLTLLPVLWLGAGSYVAWRQIDLQRHKPTWLLVHEASGSGIEESRALAELFRRCSVAQLSDTWSAVLVEQGLERQADRAAAFKGAWGDLICELRAAGKVDDQRWDRFLKQAVIAELQTRPRARREEPIRLAMAVKEVRVGSRYPFRFDGKEIERTIDGLGVSAGAFDKISFQSAAKQSPIIAASLDVDDESMRQLPDGPHTLRLELELSVTHPVSATGAATANRLPLTIACPFTLVPADASTVALDPDRSKHDEFVRGAATPRLTAPPGQAYMQAAFSVPWETHLPYAYDVWVRRGEAAVTLGTIVRSDDTVGEHVVGGTVPPELAAAGTVDVELRPNPSAAAATLDLDAILGRTLTLRDVRVVRPTTPGPHHEPDAVDTRRLTVADTVVP
jgi:hypothetical protein